MLVVLLNYLWYFNFFVREKTNNPQPCFRPRRNPAADVVIELSTKTRQDLSPAPQFEESAPKFVRLPS